jgi:hypothetical protein
MGRYLTTVANRTATRTLWAALEHCERSSLEELHADPSFLFGLADIEQRQEERLEGEIRAFYRQYRATVEGPDTFAGSFGATFTTDTVRGGVGN